MNRCGAPHEDHSAVPCYAGLALAAAALALGVGLAWLGAIAQRGIPAAPAAVMSPPVQQLAHTPASHRPDTFPPPPQPPPAAPTPPAVSASAASSSQDPADTALLERVRTTERVVALTLDLGETTTRPATQAILDYLAARDLHCTVFVTGWFIRTHPDLVAQIVAQGHDLGNHTDKHPHCPQISRERLRSELTTVEQLLAERGLALAAPKLWRPPYGEYNAEVVHTAADLGYRTVTWSATGVDYNATGDAEREAQRILKRTGPGTIILCHTGPVSQRVIPLIVEPLLEDGYRFATIQGLLEEGRAGEGGTG